ncbi:MAG: SO_0444 family Cu/Zn efflux transporter [Candidatus Polarisedimenticolaceae bacterium]|nr:SO_0444 family Cu/Zn efflux transporter [Candidatus Polarisedimenticolaceae bacterium]
MMEYLHNLLTLALDAAPWLLLGFLAAGLMKAWVPEDALSRWLGGSGIWPITKAALIGAPLPLCSCGVLPAALALRRSGASKGSTISFLIATPETGVDSIAVSYVMLGPVMAVIRPIAAILSAIFSGLLTSIAPDNIKPSSPTCSSIEIPVESECNSGCCSESVESSPSFVARTLGGIRYALGEMVEDLIIWLTIGLLLAALVTTLVPPMAMASWGSGLPAMLAMLLVGIPMYICATASTPIAAALIFSGVSPGTALVFLLAGPATNIATIGIIRQEMGTYALATYLSGIVISSLTLGLLTDWFILSQGINIQGQIDASAEWMPSWVAYLSATILLAASLKILAQKAQQRIALFTRG